MLERTRLLWRSTSPTSTVAALATAMALSAAGCATRHAGAEREPQVRDHGLRADHRESSSLKGASIAYRVVKGPNQQELTILRHSVTAELEAVDGGAPEVEVLTVVSHDVQEQPQRRLLRTGPWDGRTGSGPGGENVRYEEVIDGQRVPLKNGPQLFAALDGALEAPTPRGAELDVTTRAIPNIAVPGVGPNGCIERSSRYDTGNPETDVTFRQYDCDGLRWRWGPANLIRTQDGAPLWQRDVLAATSPGAWLCPVTYAEASSLGRQCPQGGDGRREGCMYPEGYCSCSPEPICSGLRRDPWKEPHFWRCGPFPPPNPCGGPYAPP